MGIATNADGWRLSRPRLGTCDCGCMGYVMAVYPNEGEGPPLCDLCDREARIGVLDSILLCETHFRGLTTDADGWIEHLDALAAEGIE